MLGVDICESGRANSSTTIPIQANFFYNYLLYSAMLFFLPIGSILVFVSSMDTPFSHFPNVEQITEFPLNCLSVLRPAMHAVLWCCSAIFWLNWMLKQYAYWNNYWPHSLISNCNSCHHLFDIPLYILYC